jgi:hypothetical protein
VIKIGKGNDIDDKGYKMEKAKKVTAIDKAVVDLCLGLQVIVVDKLVL